jgi:hypothetical protein
MKGSLSRLLGLLLAVSSAHAQVYNGKTYLLQRSQGVSLEKEYVTWHRHLNMSSDDRIGGSIQVVPFYQDSSHTRDASDKAKNEAGQYFGRKNGDVIEDWIGVAAADQALESADVFHVSGFRGTDGTTAIVSYATIGARRVLADKVSITPESKSVGARFDYHQKLDALLQGLYFKVNVPVVNNKTSVNAKSIDTPVKQVLPKAAFINENELVAGNPAATEAYSFLDYLAGSVSNDAQGNAQVALSKAKIVSGAHDKTGVADVDLAVGYNFLQEENYHVGLNLGVTFPTGTKPTGEFLFEPRVGTNHWGFGVGFEGGVTAWSSDCCALEMMLVGNYRYLFKDKETRTAGSVKDGNVFGQYALGDRTNAAANAALFPLANASTTDYDVTPGSQLDMIFNVAFTWNNFTFDLGYNLYFREEEKVELREFDKTVALAGVNSTTFLAAPHANRPMEVISEDTFKAEWLPSMQTPRQLTHKVYAAAGYNWNDMEYPVVLGVFGGYEFTENSACEQWNVGGKVGVTF